MDPIQAIGSLNSGAAERWRNHSEMMNLQMCEPGAAHTNSKCDTQASGAHLTPHVEPLPGPPSALNVNSAATQFSNGLKNGFYATEFERYVQKTAASKQPGSTITVADLTADVLNLHLRLGVAQACTEVSKKLAESLQTVVTKQG